MCVQGVPRRRSLIDDFDYNLIFFRSIAVHCKRYSAAAVVDGTRSGASKMTRATRTRFAARVLRFFRNIRHYYERTSNNRKRSTTNIKFKKKHIFNRFIKRHLNTFFSGKRSKNVRIEQTIFRRISAGHPVYICTIIDVRAASVSRRRARNEICIYFIYIHE